ncbi:MAG: carboxypeptidase-like regulatory domain-containing protein [Dokdonella sp.]
MIDQTESGLDGSYAFALQPPAPGDAYAIEATADGYLWLDLPFDPTTSDVHLDLPLHSAASIHGHVTRTDGHSSANTYVTLSNSSEGTWIDSSVVVQSDGTYRFDGLYPDTYRVCTGDMGLGTLRQCYDHADITSQGGEASFTPLVIAEGENRAGIDFDLVAGGAISGQFFDAHTGSPLATYPFRMSFYTSTGDFLAGELLVSDVNGRYRASGLPNGAYYLLLASAGPFSDAWQIHPGACDPTACDPTNGQLVEIANLGTVDNIDFQFHPSSYVHGRIFDATTSAGIPGVTVSGYYRHYDQGPFGGYTYEVFWSTVSGDQGHYELYMSGGAGTGNAYRIGAGHAPPHVNAAYPNIVCPHGSPNCMFYATDVLVPTGATIENIDIPMTAGASIAGTVLDATTHTPLAATVEVASEDGSAKQYIQVKSDGTFASEAWPIQTAGIAYAKAYTMSWPYSCLVYLDAPCPSFVDPISTADATPIEVHAGEVHTGIDFRLADDGIFHDSFNR